MSLSLALTGADVLQAAKEFGLVSAGATTLSSLTVSQRLELLNTIARLREVDQGDAHLELRRQELTVSKDGLKVIGGDSEAAAEFIAEVRAVLGLPPPA